MILKIIIITIIIVFLIYSYILSKYAFKKAFLAERKTEEYEVNRIKQWGIWDENYFDNILVEDLEIESKEGFKLKGHLIEPYKDSDKYIILVHGYSAHYSLHFPFVPVFINEGFNILLVEERAHGASEGNFATYGYKESEDLDLWINYLENRKGQTLFLGLHGQSMGAATVLLCGARNKKVKFIIEDCGYSSAKEQLKYEYNKVKGASFKLSYWFFWLMVKIRCKFNFSKVNPLQEILKSDTPIFFVHGTKDIKVPYEMCIKMYEKRKNDKDKILIVPNAEHLTAYKEQQEEYTKILHEFIKCAEQ
ncbi:MAG: alpha/beta hydrolase [Clostridium sp.]|nr:alpha/beta hydrolase [Clostridium sp.]